MYSPTTRLLTVLEILQARGQVSGTDLAARLEVDIRTVRRYITMLQDMGVPVEATRGRYGAYQLRSGFRLPPLLFTDDEALAVTVGLLAGRSMGLTGDPAATEGALAKLERVLPQDLRDQVRALTGALVLDLPKARVSPAADALAILSRATHQSTRVWLRHAGREPDSVTEREVEPYGLVHRNSTTYLVGYCLLRRDVRVFRLDRLLAVEPRAETFERPAELDLLEQVVQTLTTMPRAWQIEVVLDTSLEQAIQRVPSGVATLTATADGVLLNSQTESLDWFARLLLWISCPFEIINPLELRDALATVAEQAASFARHSPGESDTGTN